MKFKILMPCFNDWASVFKLLERIDNEKGKVCEVGSHNELIKRQGRYKDFCDKQFIKSF